MGGESTSQRQSDGKVLRRPTMAGRWVTRTGDRLPAHAVERAAAAARETAALNILLGLAGDLSKDPEQHGSKVLSNSKQRDEKKEKKSTKKTRGKQSSKAIEGCEPCTCLLTVSVSVLVLLVVWVLRVFKGEPRERVFRSGCRQNVEGNATKGEEEEKRRFGIMLLALLLLAPLVIPCVSPMHCPSPSVGDDMADKVALLDEHAGHGHSYHEGHAHDSHTGHGHA